MRLQKSRLEMRGAHSHGTGTDMSGCAGSKSWARYHEVYVVNKSGARY